MYQLRRFAASAYRWIKNDAAGESSKGFADLTVNSEKPTKSKRKAWLVTQWKSYIQKGTLEDFQRLCADLGLSGDLDTRTKCRKAIRGVNVNIWQFLRSNKKPDNIQFFKNRYGLIRYTRNTNSYYPKGSLGKGDPVRDLLRVMDE